MKRIIGISLLLMAAVFISCNKENIDNPHEEGLSEKAAQVTLTETQMEALSTETEYEVEFYANAERLLARWWRLGQKWRWNAKLRDLAPQNQKHEIKAAGIFNIESFYISANYVFGSGFERYDFEQGEKQNLGKEYNCLDAALVYKFRPVKVKVELGISVLNVLNTENIKYSNLRKTMVDDISLVGIYTEAVPFTPAIFLNVDL